MVKFDCVYLLENASKHNRLVAISLSFQPVSGARNSAIHPVTVLAANIELPLV
jgi:hypothetical protein